MSNNDQKSKEFYAKTTFLKVLNPDYKHYDHQYVKGLNILNQPFNDDVNDICGAGGLYFTTAEHLYKFFPKVIFDNGHNYHHIHKITLPVDDTDFKVLFVKEKYRANCLILGDEVEDEDVIELLGESSIIYFADKYRANLPEKVSIDDEMIKRFLRNVVPYMYEKLTVLNIKWKHLLDEELIKEIIHKNHNLNLLTHFQTCKVLTELDFEWKHLLTEELMIKALNYDRLNNWRFLKKELGIPFENYVNDQVILHQIKKENFDDYKYFNEYKLKWKHLVTDEIIRKKLVPQGFKYWKCLTQHSIPWKHLITKDLMEEYLQDPKRLEELVNFMLTDEFEFAHLFPETFSRRI